jgi:hypothetical protein
MKNPVPLRTVLLGGFSALLAIGLAGCASSPAPCSPAAARQGIFCYSGINFGRIDDPLLKQGIRDGCRTGKGTFTKDYKLSGSSERYRQGWIKGRALCRPANWSDSPTYSYHPLPDQSGSASAQRAATETRGLSARERMIRYAESEARDYTDSRSSSSAEDERPEMISYP